MNDYLYIDHKLEFDEGRVKRIETGLILGAGVDYALSDAVSLFAECRVMWGFTLG